MNKTVEYLLNNPEKMLAKKPFTRGGRFVPEGTNNASDIGETMTVELPKLTRFAIGQDRYMAELDPTLHDINFAENMPQVCVKIGDGQYSAVKETMMPLPYQRNILTKQVRHLCGNPTRFTLLNSDPSDEEISKYTYIKGRWTDKNMDSVKKKWINAQKSVGDSAIVMHFDDNKEINGMNISYKDGYVLCPHYNNVGKMIMMAIYYADETNQRIDAYDSTKMYKYIKKPSTDGEDKTWRLEQSMPHGFAKIPVIYKRGYVAWEFAQRAIEAFEYVHNLDIVVKKRNGWGQLYIKGNLNNIIGDRSNGSIILNDTTTNPDLSTDAKYLTPPDAAGIAVLKADLKKEIQISSSTTFILPEDIKISGDVSGIAVKLTQSMDLELAEQTASDYAPEIDYLCDLFIYGIEIEDGKIGEYSGSNLSIKASTDVCMTQNDTELKNITLQLYQVGLISLQTATEIIPGLAPDEINRIKKDNKEKREDEVINTKQITP